MKKLSRRRVGMSVGILLVLVLGLWMADRWNVWFYNPPEAPYALQPVPGRVLLTFGDREESSRNVSWQCDSVVHPSFVELACLPGGDTVRVAARGEVFRSRSGVAAYYVARLRSLRPGCSYAYRAVTGGKASPWYRFQTYAAGRDRCSFLYVGDVQDTLGGQTNRFLREALARHPRAEFLVCGGDLTERPTDEFWSETFRDMDSIVQAMPLLTVTGNHDYLKGIPVRLERRFPLVLSYFLDSMVGDNQVYTLCYGPVQFFLLDSNRELPYLLEQRVWLEEQLRRSEAQWKVVVLHHPLYSIKGMNNLIQRWVFNGLVEDYGVDLVLQGHEHAYARMSRRDERGRSVAPVYVVSHCSPKNYRIEFDDRFDKFGISSRYYQTVDLCGDTLVLSSYEVYGHTLYDSLHIVKQAAPAAAPALVRDFGRSIPEYMEFTPAPGSRKDKAYAKRIADYKRRHPERQRREL